MLVKTYKTLPVTLVRGQGAHVWDAANRRYLDMYAGHAVASTGHAHPHVSRAIAEQAQRLIFYSNVMGLEVRDRAVKKLMSFAPPGITHALFLNSGAEAVENALKMAVLQTGRKQLITFEGGFHGRTLLATNVTGTEKYRKVAPYKLDDIVVCPFGNIESVRSAMGNRTAAVILEPIQSMAGCRMAPPEFYRELRALTEQHGAYLVYDEIQTGIGRTGRMFFSGLYEVVPDILCLAKGIASGIPLSAVLVSPAVADRVQYGEYGATFGAGPIAMAAMQATLEVIEQEDLLARVRSVSEFLRHELEAVSGVEEVLGLGFLMGVRTRHPAAELQSRLLEWQVIVGTSEDKRVIRLLPPLVLQRPEAEAFMNIFRECCS